MTAHGPLDPVPALVDGRHRDVATRLTTRNEYLRVTGRFHDIPGTLRDFPHHIVAGSPAPWPAHVAGHPPAATLTFVPLDRAGPRGGGWAGAWCVTVGATACVAVLVAVREPAGEDPARRAAPFLAAAPAAVWVGASADGYSAAVAAWSVALLPLAVRGRTRTGTRAAAAVVSGLPFALWLLPARALPTRPRAWLAAQTVLALLLNHLLPTGW